MSFHDRHLRVAVETKRSRARINCMKSVLRGINQMSLTTSVPNIHFGSLREDAQKIGSDMRKAITRIERCE